MDRQQRITHCSYLALGTAAALAGGLAAAPARAQERSLLMEEILVTAQKREQSAQDVGIAITAFTGEQLRALGYTNAQEVTALAPGVSTLQPNGEANYAIGIRGVANNDFTTNVESPVAIYVDEVYISQMSGAGFLLFDIDRVEILRGPQGTLFGRNATGGLVQYVTVKPSQEFNGYGDVSYGSFDRIKFQGAVGVPLTDTLSARISLATHQGGGYVDNRLSPEAKLNNANESAGRVQLLFAPNESIDFLVNARFGQQDIRTGFFEYVSAIFPTGQATPGVPNANLGGYVDNDGDVFAGDYDFTGRNDLQTYGLTGTLNWRLSLGTLTSITDYQELKRDYIEDSDASPVDYFNFFLTSDVEQFSQELRLSGESAALKWVAGVYYLDLDIDDSNGGIAPALFDTLGLSSLGIDLGATDFPLNGLRNPYQTETRSWSLFGQLEYALSDRLTLIGGLRWIQEKKTHSYRNIFSNFDDLARSGLDPRTREGFDGVAPYDGQIDQGNWSARVQMDYQPNDSLLTYASWNRGVKSGGFNAPLLPTDILVTDAFMQYDAEKLDAFELGFKWDAAGGRLRLNGAGYYYDYKNCQTFSIIGLDTFTLNSDCKSKGFELEAQAMPAAGLDLQLGVGFIDAEVRDVPGLTIDVETPAGTAVAILPGATVTPVQSPKWNVNGLIRYEVPVTAHGAIALQADGQYRSKHFFALTQFPASTQGGYVLANASVTWLPESRDWALRFFVHNLTDKKYLVQTFDLSGNVDNGGFFGLIEQYYGRPRTWGVNLSYNF
ncbi:MAG: TonB-dependent receptor [Pseudomonadota bacterium]